MQHVWRSRYPGKYELSCARTTKKLKPGGLAARRRSHVRARVPEGISDTFPARKVQLLGQKLKLGALLRICLWGDIARPPRGVSWVHSMLRGRQSVLLCAFWSQLLTQIWHLRAARQARRAIF